jgi:beta-lactam-binding protein with PASTA domain
MTRKRKSRHPGADRPGAFRLFRGEHQKPADAQEGPDTADSGGAGTDTVNTRAVRQEAARGPDDTLRGFNAVTADGARPNASAPEPSRAPGDGGDTIRLRSIRPDPAKEAFARAAAREERIAHPPRPRPMERVEKLPRRRPREEGGFFSFVFGIIGLVIRMVIVIVLVAIIGGFLGYETIRWYVKTPEVVVPNVRGMKVADAFEIVSQKKLALEKERSEANAIVASGEIIDQKPPPGGKTKEGTAVRVIISSGRANLVVPDVVGETRENAETKIKGAGLEVGNVTYLEDDRVPRDGVISQNPEANKGLDQATPVHLLLSSGPRGSALIMPDLAGRTIAEARTILAGLGVTNIAVEPAGADGIIGEQEPLFGKAILQSQHVILRIRK